MPPAKRPGNPATDPGILLKRKKDRQKANERLQLRLDEQGVRRTESENNLSFSSIPQVLLINQKNYYTEYLKKDENFRILRNMKEMSNKTLNSKPTTTKKGSDLDRIKGGSVSVSVSANVTENEYDDDDNDDDNEDDSEKTRTLVIHPGSHDIKIGWAGDVDPILVPNLIGYVKRDSDFSDGAHSSTCDGYDTSGLDPPRFFKTTTVSEEKSISNDDNDDNDDNDESNQYFVLNDEKEFNAKRKPIVSSYRERMKYYKRRILPNCHEACFNFNLKELKNHGHVEYVNDDAAHINNFIRAPKWIEETGRDYVVGEEVLRIKDENDWLIRSPFLFSSFGNTSAVSKKSSVELGFNEQDINYSSPEEILGDIEIILYHTIINKFNISKKDDFKKINVVLVVPSLYRKSYVELMMELLLTRLNFKNATFVQEGMSASFGLGLSTGCIVDVGSSSIHICCVDDGAVLEDTRVSLDYGMSDVVRFWGKSLIQQQFPYYEVNFEKLKDWKLIENTFAEFGTFDDSKSGSIQIGNLSFYEDDASRVKIKKYQYKCFDEGMVCPMGLFYPDIFIETENRREKSPVLTNDKQRNKIVLGKITPAKKIHKPLFEGSSNKFTGYSNSDPISILQDLQRTGVKISEMNLEQLLELLVELSELFVSSNTIGSGRRGKTNDISNKLKSRYRNAHYAQQEQGKEQEQGDNNENVTTDSIRQNMTPLDLAIIESITVAGLSDQSRFEKMYSNICLVGGGAKLDGFDNILMDRLHLNRNEILSSSKLVDALNLIKYWKAAFEKEQKIRAKEKEEKEKAERAERAEKAEKEKEKEKEKVADDDDDNEDDGGSDDEGGIDKDGNKDEIFKLNKEQLQELMDLLLEGTAMNIDITGKGEVDPLVLGWKGACIYARLKIIEEMWISGEDWDILGSRSLNYGSLFNY